MMGTFNKLPPRGEAYTRVHVCGDCFWHYILCICTLSEEALCVGGGNKSKVLINLCVCICVKDSELRVHFPGPGVMEGGEL